MLSLRRWSEEKFSASEPSKYPEGFEGVDRQIGLKSSGGKCSRQAAKAVSTKDTDEGIPEDRDEIACVREEERRRRRMEDKRGSKRNWRAAPKRK